MKRLIVLLLLAGLVSGCAQKTTQINFVATGESLAAVGNQFADVGAVYTTNCKPTPKAVEFTTFCNGFAEFAPHFKRAYPLALQAWSIAVEANDINQAQGAMATIVNLATRLTELALSVIGGAK
jgi:hypothetical protein